MTRLTSVTNGHKRLMKLLVGLGLGVRIEQAFGPYQVDVYCEEAHVAFEFDGPMHSKEKDAKRDLWLLEQAGLPVLRIESWELMNAEKRQRTEQRVRSFIDEHAGTLEARRARGRWTR